MFMALLQGGVGPEAKTKEKGDIEPGKEEGRGHEKQPQKSSICPLLR